ncbi:DNA mismatch repair endonuclease MutL [Roseisolibacter sp. H3M3-2]|uniref:DNA mismatch repair endonuclease MutL n=1 Tax=Roseisolibacter sp. H3M3-2 TaxID=3031323 RepID=UPI0023DA742D|nr:DNA mismatch repair endonuclease MutL [Roseisolibacter sp. H3M3-2]MDF1504946.1 DNA mismatch repair endonuclease MutL [Roseisolibacter sp. H3M3-2]
MPRIAVLPPAVADQIAAGEVVERPASVVKELVENALDAGATAVEVTVEEGGRALVRVSDDGSGMGREDAVLALSRHATSKIRHAEELVGVASFGFRGEALPAICSVSHLELETSPEDGAGTRVRASGGALQGVEDAARRRGTTVSVARLFHNTPARQKFLRSARSEWRAISDVLVVMALTRRDVRLSATHDGKSSLALPAAPSLRARLGAIHGARYADGLLDVEDVAGAVHVTGLVERPGDVGTAARRVFLAVNGRAVRDTGLVRAAEAAYRSTIPAGLRPSLFLEVVLPAGELDVNVHPAKAEVRFGDRWAVERAVERAVRRALGTLDSAADVGGRGWFAGGLLNGARPEPAVNPWAEAGRDVGALHLEAGPTVGLFADPDAPAPHDPRAFDGAPHGAPALPWEVAAPAAAPAPPDEEEIAVPPLVQLRRTYMMFERDEGVVLIDQHSAHERVLYERFLGAMARGESPSQRLLFPLTLHLGPAQADAFEANRDALTRLGYEVEPFGGGSLLVHAVPTPHPRFDAERCLRDTLDALTGDRHAAAHARHERLAATVACKAAVKAGDALSPDEMRALFVALARTTLPAHDVHGRATIVHLGWDELERRFGRA